MPRVVKVLEPADRGAAVARDTLLLTYSQRAMQHGFAFGAKGTCVELDFAEPIVLRTDDVLMLDDLTAVDVVAEAEPVIEVRPHDAAALARLAWTLGDRHVPAQIFSNRLRVLRSPENDAMVADYGRTTVLIAPFEPDHAPTHGHDHGHHDHHHGHAHSHDHDHHAHAGHDHAPHDHDHGAHDHGHDDHAGHDHPHHGAHRHHEGKG
jgi:urease accessory protein